MLINLVELLDLDNDVELKNEMNYFRCIRQILRDSYDRDFPVFFRVFQITRNW